MITDLCTYTLHAMFANMKPVMCAGEIQEGVVSGTPNIKMGTLHVYVLLYVPTCRIKHCDACIIL